MRIDGFDASQVMRRLWNTLHRVPGGKAIFSASLGRLAPYTGSIKPKVLELEHGRSKTALMDRPAVRNHLGSIHAIALMNIAEVTTGVCLIYSLPKGARAILTGLSIDYLHKARGTITGICEFTPPTELTRQELTLEGVLRNEEGVIVAKAQARWLVGPMQR